MSDNSFFLKKEPENFSDFLNILFCEVPENYTVLYRGQNDKQWSLNSTLARLVSQVPLPIRYLVALEEMKLYFEKNVPSEELIQLKNKGIDPYFVLGKYLQQNPMGKKIKNKPKGLKISTPFIDFTIDPYVALFFANYRLQYISEKIFNSTLDGTTDGAIFIIYISNDLIKKNYEAVIEHIVFYLKKDALPPPIYWKPKVNLNDIDDEKPNRQKAEYIFQSSLNLHIEAFTSKELRITKVILKNEIYNEVSEFLNSKGYTFNSLFSGHILKTI